MKKNLTWGIMGAGIIAEKMASAIDATDLCTLKAVGSKSPDRARIFAERHPTATPCTYEELTARADIDVVYVATTHNFHFENIAAALTAGKHVLAEKPVTVNATEARKLKAMAAQGGLFLMEGIWTRCLPAIKWLKQHLDRGTIGEVKAVQISFGSDAPARYRNRLQSPELAGGVTLDMGVYPISMACYFMGSLPEEVQSMAHFCETGVDDTAQYMMRFSDGRFASLSASFNLKMENTAHIYGSKGRIAMPDFHRGDHFEILMYDEAGGTTSSETVRPDQHENGFMHEVEEVRDCIAAGMTESPLMPVDESISIMEIMDAMRAEWGLKYPFENARKKKTNPLTETVKGLNKSR